MTFVQNGLGVANGGVLQSSAQPTHIVRVLGGGMSRPTRTNVRGVLTHAKSCKKEDEEGREKEGKEGEEEGEEIGLHFSTAPLRRARRSRSLPLRRYGVTDDEGKGRGFRALALRRRQGGRGQPVSGVGKFHSLFAFLLTKPEYQG